MTGDSVYHKYRENATGGKSVQQEAAAAAKWQRCRALIANNVKASINNDSSKQLKQTLIYDTLV
jgi:hypothetical protein